MSFICHQQVELHKVILDGQFDASGLCDDTIRSDRSSYLRGEACEAFAVALCADTRLRLSCAKNHCQNRISVCAHCHITGLFLSRQLWAVWDLSLPEAILCGSIHPLTHKHTHWHVHSHMQTHRYLRAHTQRGKTSHLVPRRRHFCGKLEWHQLHSDKNGFGPGCWLSNTFWCRSTGRFIRSQIRRLTFTPKHISRSGRRQTELMHRITPCSLQHSFHFPLFIVPHYFWKVWGY